MQCFFHHFKEFVFRINFENVILVLSFGKLKFITYPGYLPGSADSLLDVICSLWFYIPVFLEIFFLVWFVWRHTVNFRMFHLYSKCGHILLTLGALKYFSFFSTFFPLFSPKFHSMIIIILFYNSLLFFFYGYH